jgi:hypothetical protein
VRGTALVRRRLNFRAQPRPPEAARGPRGAAHRAPLHAQLAGNALLH